MIVTEAHMKAGVALVEQQLPASKRVMMWAGTSAYVQARSKLIDFMVKSGTLATRRDLLRYMAIGYEEFDKLVYTLVQDGTLEIVPMKVKSEVVIKLRS